MCKRDPHQSLLVLLWQRGLTWRVGFLKVAENLVVVVSLPVLVTPTNKGIWGHGIPDVLQSTTSSSSSSVVQSWTLPQFSDQWRSITSNWLVFNMVKDHHLQLRSCPPLFCNFKELNTKGAAAHHPIIQKEVDELLVIRAIEPYSGGAGFYSNVFVVPKHIDGFGPYLPLRSLIGICTSLLVRCLLIDM